jgi:TfoX/Sxy family transcriptional regulator of competence genes
MPVSAAYKSFIQDLLAEFGPVSIRHMFSGVGVYADG